jgi:hypothetical protein
MTTDDYYWSQGRKVSLLPSDQVVIEDGAAGSGSTAAAGLEALRQKGIPVSPGYVMVQKDAARAVLGDATEGSHPVFRTEDGSLLAVLPEVRVEGEPERLDSVSRTVTGAHVTERTDDRLTLVPDSGLGQDALRIANQLAEAGGVDVSQARFVRLVKRPGL